ANDGGYFTQQGLDVELTYIEGSAKAAAAMIGGSVENGEMAAAGTIQAIVKGGDLIIVAGFNNYSPFKLVVDPSKVKTIADLKGKTIATTQGGSADEFTLYKVLSLNGLSRQDVNVTYMTGGDPARLAALQAHRIDASMVSADFGRAAVKQGAVILVDTIPMKITEPQNTLVTTRAYLSGHRPELLSFLKAEAQGIHRYKADKPFALQVMSKYLKTTDQDLLEGSYEAYSQLIPDDMKVLPESIQTVLDQDKIAGHKPQDFFDMSLVDELTASGFLKSL
ncbi:MAG TPA: ABC transporter substrate-binding protein, partial [Chloroflexota bacterium]